MPLSATGPLLGVAMHPSRIGQPVRRAPVVGVRPTRHSRTSVMAAAANVDGTWEFIWRTLVESRVKSVPPAEAKAMVDSGEWVLVDVRPTEDFNKAHIQGAVSCPLFLKVTRENFAPSDFLKSMVLMANGVTPIKNNAAFLTDLPKLSGGKKPIMYCEAGGTLNASSNFPFGKASRSLRAVFQVLASKTADASSVAHLDGGIYGWDAEDLPVDGEYDGSNAGRTPAAAEPAQFPNRG